MCGHDRAKVGRGRIGEVGTLIVAVPCGECNVEEKFGDARRGLNAKKREKFSGADS